MSQTSETINFVDLINEWHELMCVEEGPASLEDYGISVLSEERVIELTAQYIGKLKGMRDKADSQSEEFSLNVARRLADDQRTPSSILDACDRFLTNVGTLFRGIIPKTFPRSVRRKSRNLVIDWSEASGQGNWLELDFSFSIEESLLFCAESLAGADSILADGMAKQLISDLKDGDVSLPRLTQVAKDKSTTTYYWESSVVSMVPSEVNASSESMPELNFRKISPVLCEFEDMIHASQIEINGQLASEDEYKDPLSRAAAVMQRLVLPDDGTSQRVNEFARKLSVYAGEEPNTLGQAMSDCAYWGTVAAIVHRDKKKLEKRLRVMKSCNALCDREELVF